MQTNAGSLEKKDWIPSPVPIRCLPTSIYSAGMDQGAICSPLLVVIKLFQVSEHKYKTFLEPCNHCVFFAFLTWKLQLYCRYVWYLYGTFHILKSFSLTCDPGYAIILCYYEVCVHRPYNKWLSTPHPSSWLTLLYFKGFHGYSFQKYVHNDMGRLFYKSVLVTDNMPNSIAYTYTLHIQKSTCVLNLFGIGLLSFPWNIK
jgi:hypothetical protein